MTRLQMTRYKRWRSAGDVSALGDAPAAASGLRPLTAALLALRGLHSPAEQRDFLNRKSLRDLPDFWQLPDMAAGVESIRRAVREQQKICVFGDYDADGMTAAALLVKALASLGSKADCYIPGRLGEGYGLNKEALKRIKERGAGLVITVDCGISAAEEAAYAKSLGLELVITDHHRPPKVLPEAAALINPELMREPGGLRGLAGAGVAFALAACLLQDRGGEAATEPGGSGARVLGGGDAEMPVPGGAITPGDSGAGVPALPDPPAAPSALLAPLAQLAAIGTLADAVPLTGCNRILAAAGLAEINRAPLPGIAALIKTGGLAEKTVRSGHVAFTLAPRLNAAGRMGDPSLAVKLLLAESGAEAVPLALELEERNKERQETESRILEEVLTRLEQEPERAAKPVLVLAGEGWHMGVIGIVAARLTEKLRRPVVLISVEGELGRGSGRSVPGCNLHEALTAAADMLLTFGGHEAACGFQISGNMPEPFAAKLEAYAALHWQLPGEGEGGEQKADLTVGPDQLSLAAIEELELLAPFGGGNPQPLLILPDMRLSEIKALGQEKRHYKLFFREQRTAGPLRESGELTAVAFSMEEHFPYPQTGGCYDLLFRPEINEWRGSASVQLLLKDMRPAQAEAEKGKPEKTEAGLGQERESQAGLGPERQSAGEIWEPYRKAVLGGRGYREKQLEALEALRAKKNTLLIMATGRGKTAVFQTAAAALGRNAVTILIYPLRSLARDQKRRMEKVLEPMGIHTVLAWGGLEHWEKKTFFKNLYQGNVQVVITTAEFLQAHLEKFKAVAPEIGLFVVDEAHHLGTSRRQAYKDLRTAWKKLGCPLFFASTATAGESCAAKIAGDFGVERLITEEHCRENLSLTDARDRKEKLDYLLEIVSPGRKMIVYVNSRPLAEELAGTLREHLPLMGDKIGYYHGGLPPERRQAAEGAFLEGRLTLLVSTSAFGEGADIPDIRDVVLYHLCFSRAEYNQLSGRAGRDGLPARIHLLYNEKDRELNRLLLNGESPGREALGSFYLYLREKAAGENPLTLSDDALAGEMNRRGHNGFTPKLCARCLGILEEIALLLREEEEGVRYIHMAPPPPAKLDLNHSPLYKEGLETALLFEEFLPLAFSPDPDTLLAGVNRPILPGNLQLPGDPQLPGKEV